jgi:ribonuclease P/MRP protein subunit POP7
VGGEMVYLKATGRAIPRALELGVKFQGEEDCVVRVEIGNVRAIDDVEVREAEDGDGAEGEDEEEEVPETQIRTLSTVTVCIGLR